MVSSARRRAAVQELRTSRGYSERRACQLMGCSRSTARYCLKRLDDSAMTERMRAIIADGNNRSGYRLLNFLLRRDQKIVVNHKRFYRIYRAAGLQVPKRKKRHARYLRNGTTMPATRPNERWSMDFVHDTLSSGRNVRLLTVVDDFTRESLAIEVDSTLPSRRVIAVLERVIAQRGLPEVPKRTTAPNSPVSLRESGLLCAACVSTLSILASQRKTGISRALILDCATSCSMSTGSRRSTKCVALRKPTAFDTTRTARMDPSAMRRQKTSHANILNLTKTRRHNSKRPKLWG